MDKTTKAMSAKARTQEETSEIIETTDALTPDPETVVPTGDESYPVSGPSDPKEARKALYDKAKKNRETTISRESEKNVDVELINAWQAEASGGEMPEKGIDTNRKDRYTLEEEQAAAELMAEEPEPEETHEEKIVDRAEDSLTRRDPEAKVQVKILGKEYSVPQQDIDDAGGLETYQKSRAATMRLQRIATLEKALPAEPEQRDAHGEQQETDPSTDGLGEADIASLREEVVEAMVEGDDMSALDTVLEKVLKSRPAPTPKPKPSQPNEISVTERQIIEEAQRELAEQWDIDRKDANDMMRQEYSDIMGDKELLVLAQQRFSMLAADPINEGRSQKEVARESAEYVRSLGKRLLVQPPADNQIETERQQRITRKRKLPQASRADAPAAPVSQERKPMSRKEYMRMLQESRGRG